MDIQKKLLIIGGPTASGKTKLSVELAKCLEGEVVSADSMQIYQRFSIGTAKPTLEEMQGVPHHLIDFLPPEELFSVAQYAALARRTIGEIHARGHLPVLTGGTGLYLQAIIDNIQFEEMPENTAVRARLRQELEELGKDAMLARLQQCDPALAETLHSNDLGRILRALEVFELTGKPMSLWQEQSRRIPSDYDIVMLGITYRDRKLLYDRINRRVGHMLEAGLLEEARALFQSECAGTAAQAIGYKELFGYLRGEQTVEEAVERLRMQTRRYAKRQLTWLRRNESIRWLYADDFATEDDLVQYAYEQVRLVWG